MYFDLFVHCQRPIAQLFGRKKWILKRHLKNLFTFAFSNPEHTFTASAGLKTKGSGKLYLAVAKILLYGLHRACSHKIKMEELLQIDFDFAFAKAGKGTDFTLNPQQKSRNEAALCHKKNVSGVLPTRI